MSHAVISTFTARRGEDGHRVFSFPSTGCALRGLDDCCLWLVPDRFGAKDALRIGNYSNAGLYGREHCAGVFFIAARTRCLHACT